MNKREKQFEELREVYVRKLMELVEDAGTELGPAVARQASADLASFDRFIEGHK